MKKHYLILPAAAILLGACAHGGAAHQPIVDGPMDATYHADLNDCRGFAENRSYNNSDVQTSALIGAGLGGLFAAVDSYDADTNDILTGALVGALFGGGDKALETRGQRREILLNCMAGRGHRILG